MYNIIAIQIHNFEHILVHMHYDQDNTNNATTIMHSIYTKYLKFSEKSMFIILKMYCHTIF